MFSWLLEYQQKDSLLASFTESVLPEVFIQSVQTYCTTKQFQKSFSNYQFKSKYSSLSNHHSSSLITSVQDISTQSSVGILGFNDNFVNNKTEQMRYSRSSTFLSLFI